MEYTITVEEFRGRGLVRRDEPRETGPEGIWSELSDLGDLALDDVWDDLLVKTPALPCPQKCTARLLLGTGGGAEIRVNGSTVHRIHGLKEEK